MMTFEHSNKYKVLAAAVAIILHGVAGVGLATMQMLHIEPPKITPPLEIQMIKLNNEESPEPPTPIPAPEPTPAPAQSVAALAPPKASPPPPPKAPKPEPRPEPKKEPVKLEPKEPPKVTEPQVDIIAQERAQKAFELQQQREREQREREQQERERQVERERQAERDRQAELARQQAERDRQAELARQKAEADAKARAEQGQGKGGDGKDTKTDNKTGNKDTTKSGGTGGGELKGQNLGTVSNASWKSRPNWSGLTSEKLSGSANFVATLTIDANGRITSVSGVNTGDKGLDRQISQALRRARFHPFKSSSGQPMSGTATFSTTVQF